MLNAPTIDQLDITLNIQSVVYQAELAQLANAAEAAKDRYRIEAEEVAQTIRKFIASIDDYMCATYSAIDAYALASDLVRAGEIWPAGHDMSHKDNAVLVGNSIAKDIYMAIANQVRARSRMLDANIMGFARVF